MKKVKVMLSAILVMAIVAGALAFKVKSPNVCAYSTTDAEGTTEFLACPRVASDVATITTTGASTQYAKTIATAASGAKCPLTTTICDQSLTLAAGGE